MNEYTASNGLVVRFGEPQPGESQFIPVTIGAELDTLLRPVEANALREFFRAEEDERLGRWRWPENPDYVVYPTEYGCRIIDESTGQWFSWNRGWITTPGFDKNESFSAARAYFDSYPEPKPWHDAEPGEVWLLTFSGFETDGSSPWTVRTGRLTTDPAEFIYPQNGNTVALTDPEIVDARRIYPEAS